MLLLHLMSKEETEEAIELLRYKLQVSLENDGLYNNRTIELNNQLSLYINHYRILMELKNQD